ncbi:MAG: alanyl-tRNA editing protein [Sandaracinus sp.]
MTERLYYADTFLFDFDAKVVAHDRLGDAAAVVLDRSAFYPESGGQMADRGTLGSARVVDVQIDDAGIVRHAIEGALPEIGATVRCVIDAPRRRQFAALHTAQHILSRALVDVAKADTVSSRLGETLATIDVKETLSDARVAECERIANDLVDASRAVRAWFPSDEELKMLPMRRAPKQSENIRVVEVAGFDVSPCGGTHVTSTAQIGLVRVVGSEKYKGGTRVSFHAGARARTMLFGEDDALRALARSLVCGIDAVPAGVERLRAELTAAHGEAGRLRSALAQRIAGDATKTAGDRIELVLDEGGVELAQKVAAELTKEGARLALVAVKTDEGAHLVVARGPASTENAGAIVKAITAAAGGKGGGRPERAEGRLPAGADVATLLRGGAA